MTEGIMGARWRVRWVAAIALLRAVGHVLRNVDSKTDPGWKNAIDAAWSQLLASKPKPAIYWEFIQDERNSVLKEYRPKAGQGVTIHVGSTPVEYAYAMNDGTYKGRDPRDVVREAIDWWDDYLRDIEKAYAQGRT